VMTMLRTEDELPAIILTIDEEGAGLYGLLSAPRGERRRGGGCCRRRLTFCGISGAALAGA